MQLTPVDWAVIVGFFCVNLGIGAYYARRGGKSLGDYFLSGRSAPWWLAGTSMVATTFAADTPLAVTSFVAKNGIAGNWLWWNMVMSGILTTVFFAALWRRSGVLTDVEFTELRYAGTPAAALRLTRALYQGVIINTIIMGWVNLAIAKILGTVLGIPKWEAIGICLLLTGIYVTIGGFWSVLVTDVLQFVTKLTMTIVLAVVAVAAVGGIGALKVGIARIDTAHHVAGGGSLLAFFPTTGGDSWMPLTSFLVFIAVSWWASSYPGAEPGGGSYVAQRIFASKDEKNSVLATLFFNVAHYAIRPWPWILVALSALLLYPAGIKNAAGVVDPELLYVQTMIDHLPPALRGLMMAGFLAAYMSTIGTHLNLGASYLTNDLYKRFIRRDADDTHYVWASRIATLLAMVLAAAVTVGMDSVGKAWEYIITFTAGVGLVMILRWYWWRVNAYSEIAALIASGVTATIVQATHVFSGPNATASNLLVTVAVTTVVWVGVTFATRPEPDATLLAFYDRVRPAVGGWRRIAALSTSAPAQEELGLGLRDWFAGCGLVYGSLFGIGKLVLGDISMGFVFLALAALCAYVFLRDLNSRAPRLPARVVAATAIVLATLVLPASVKAAEDKVLSSLKGSVSYEKTGKAGVPLAPSSTVLLTDKDIAVTGDASQATVQLPDSSKVTLASDTRVQMAFFNQTDVANAKFIVYEGKTRFKVEHPQGSKANYTFVTPTSTISVRGTEGDIGIDGDKLTLNVYEASVDVEVTFDKGDNGKPKTIFVKAGQSLVANLVNGIIQANVDKLTQAAVDKFNEMGVPTSAQAALDKAKSAITDKINQAASGFHFPH